MARPRGLSGKSEADLRRQSTVSSIGVVEKLSDAQTDQHRDNVDSYLREIKANKSHPLHETLLSLEKEIQGRDSPASGSLRVESKGDSKRERKESDATNLAEIIAKSMPVTFQLKLSDEHREELKKLVVPYTSIILNSPISKMAMDRGEKDPRPLNRLRWKEEVLADTIKTLKGNEEDDPRWLKKKIKELKKASTNIEKEIREGYIPIRGKVTSEQMKEIFEGYHKDVKDEILTPRIEMLESIENLKNEGIEHSKFIAILEKQAQALARECQYHPANIRKHINQLTSELENSLEKRDDALTGKLLQELNYALNVLKDLNPGQTRVLETKDLEKPVFPWLAFVLPPDRNAIVQDTSNYIRKKLTEDMELRAKQGAILAKAIREYDKDIKRADLLLEDKVNAIFGFKVFQTSEAKDVEAIKQSIRDFLVKGGEVFEHPKPDQIDLAQLSLMARPLGIDLPRRGSRLDPMPSISRSGSKLHSDIKKQELKYFESDREAFLAAWGVNKDKENKEPPATEDQFAKPKYLPAYNAGLDAAKKASGSETAMGAFKKWQAGPKKGEPGVATETKPELREGFAAAAPASSTSARVMGTLNSHAHAAPRPEFSSLPEGDLITPSAARGAPSGRAQSYVSGPPSDLPGSVAEPASPAGEVKRSRSASPASASPAGPGAGSPSTIQRASRRTTIMTPDRSDDVGSLKHRRKTLPSSLATVPESEPLSREDKRRAHLGQLVSGSPSAASGEDEYRRTRKKP